MRPAERVGDRRFLPLPDPEAAVVWHDVECGAYAADLPLWEELADSTDGPILDLGCGTGRVALYLAGRGQPVHGLDLDPGMVAALNERARELPAEAEVGDARDFRLGVEFGLAIAPMQLLQLFAGAEERIACLSCAASHLRPGGGFGVALVEGLPSEMAVGAGDSDLELRAVPDVREVEGWVYSSLPLETAVDGDEMVVRRLRQTVAPGGEMSEELDEIRLRELDAATLEEEAAAAGLRPAGRREVAETADHVGSTVVMLARET